MTKDQSDKVVNIDGNNINLKQILDVANGRAIVNISSDKEFVNRMELSQKMLFKALKNGMPIYGVTTGYGKSCGNRIHQDIIKQNGENLLRFHGCGTGEPIGIEETRAAIMCRIICLSKSLSGVSIELIDQLALFLNRGITPVVPCEGSVGASGDLTPMSYIAACLSGEREVFYKGKRMSSLQALKQEGLTPYTFKPKEALSMINGTSTMTGIAVINIERARNILNAVISATALSVHALKGNSHHFHRLIAESKPFNGLIYVSKQLTNLLSTTRSNSDIEANSLENLQDPYSLRCAPQIVGVLYDSLEWIYRWVETEANSSNDNPIICPDTGQILMGGNFYGGHIACAMDTLKTSLASVADMSDRQIELLVNPNQNRGLPADLVRAKNNGSIFHYGFKAMSISASALTAEALKETMPASSFSRSTESHNQDKVSMGTIAARDAGRICYLVERVIAIHLLAAVQACEIRGAIEIRPKLASIVRAVRSIAEPTIEDRPMDSDIENIAKAIIKNKLF
ncbi:MAG: aromatic amino acid ammonia-lyase [Spirochaetota bacterium]|nr:aromatic amino acid ammonia-lyase [Spirochaetota bacterium]